MFVTPVSLIHYNDRDINLPMTVTDDGHKIPHAKYSSAIKAWLEDIIYGRVDHEWGYVVEEQ